MAYVWNCPADKLLREVYPTHGAAHVAAILGITVKQVYHRARRIKVKTKAVRGKPFTSNDPRRGKGRPFTKN